ncbi:GNAT family N-acetyltransferase [Arenimonas caeni]|uniref:GNAT family N-acetyltransferase n=1 Tax=Arenimonas caeni TaxID=2058085 RepID=A0A2P6MAJ5_9GAMM|nr:GNAT family N-acetyltransferase [Arenimonas caeni]PRH83010.1 GNAT family N-acetyltransferase [Arenimonas caeni]
MDALTQPPVLEGQALRLRPLREADAEALFALYGDPGVCRYWSFAPWTELAQARAWLAERMAWRPPATFGWALADRGDDQLLGTVSLFSLSAPNRRAELGYSLLPARQGRGLAREAVRLALDFAFGPLALERVEADVDPGNEPSWRLLEHFGFRREGLLRNRWRVGDTFADSWIYGLLAGEHRGTA